MNMGNDFISANRKPSFPAETILPGHVTINRTYFCQDELEIYEAKTADDRCCTAILWRFSDAGISRLLLDLQQKWWSSLDLKSQMDLFPMGKYFYLCGLIEMRVVSLESLPQYQKGISFPLDFTLKVVSELCAAGNKAMAMGLRCCVHPALIWLDPDDKPILPIIVEGGKPTDSPKFYRNLIGISHEEDERVISFMLGSLLYRLLSGIRVDIQKQDPQISIENLPPLSKWNREVSPELSKLAYFCLSSICSPEPIKIDQISDALTNLRTSECHCSQENQALKKQTETISDARPIRHGLAAVAGMRSLKKLLVQEVIEPFKNPGKYHKFGLNIPNGILLFGPPGCGKTYIARKLAEELGFHYQEIIPSAIASSYIHGTTMHIQKLFRKAERKAPSLIFVDEIDALVPTRSALMDSQHFKSEEVSELLIQLNNCAEKNIIVLGASNEPNKIDPAILRPGRFDKLIYVEPPDEEARIALLELYLENRPVDSGFSCPGLAKKLVRYSCSDIRLLVDEASRVAIKEDAKYIAELHFAKAIKIIPPSIEPQELMQYRHFGGRG